MNNQTTHIKEGKKKQRRNRITWKTRFEMAMNTYVSIITLNVNGLNASIKRVADCIKKKKTTNTRAYNMLPMRDPLRAKDMHRLK